MYFFGYEAFEERKPEYRIIRLPGIAD